MDAINQTVKDKGYAFLTADQKATYNQTQPVPKVATPPVQSPNVINSSVLAAPITQTNFQQSVPPPPVQLPPMPVPEPAPIPLTPLEQRMQAESDKALAANDSLVGRSAFASEQQNLAGVGEQSKLQKELTAQLVAIGNEAKAIPLKMQAQAEGRGVTAGGLAPIESAANRNNAIQALTLNSQLAAVQGNLQNAMDMADRAVEAKYGPIEAQLKTSLSNLELISKSPQYTREQKARADAMATQQQAKLDAIATEKENAQAVSDALIKTISYNQGIDQMSIRALNAAKTPAEFAAIANYLGLETMSPQDRADLEYKQAQTAGLGAKDLQFVSGTENQAAGYFDKKTGRFTPIGGGSNNSSSYTMDANGNMVAGAMYLGPSGRPLSANALAYGEDYAKTGNKPNAAELKQAGITFAEVEAASKVGGAAKAKTEELDRNIELVDEVMNSPYLKQVTGAVNPFTYWTPGTNEQYVKAMLSQIVSTIKLENRQKLKGQGTITDPEMKTLSEASTALSANLSDEDTKLALQKVKDAFISAKKYVGDQSQKAEALPPGGTSDNPLAI